MLKKSVIGTIEFTPYSSTIQKSTVERHFPFSFLERIILEQNHVWEIDKLCLHQDFQRIGYFQEFIKIFYNHARQYQPKYYVGIMEKKFYRMSRIPLGLNVMQVGEEIVCS